MKCKHGDRCSGCPWIDVPYSTQLERKNFGPVPFNIQSVGDDHFRERVDLVIQDGRMGLYDLTHSEIVDVEECPVLTLPLESWLLDFRKLLPPIKKGSVRLRVAPDGSRGAWLDFSNLDVKALLEEGGYLTALLDQSIVEIGQRHKRLALVEGKLKLTDPVLNVWSETYADDTALPLYSTIGSFTQVGRKANRLLTDTVKSLFPNELPERWVEFGAGSGTFTLPLLKWGAKVEAFEIEERAISGLVRSAEELSLSHSLTVHRKNFSDKSTDWATYFKGVEAVLADPPRSGIAPLLTELVLLPKETLPRYFVYVSCFKESFERDSSILVNGTYKMKTLVGVDQFPHTPHCEYVALFEKC